MLLKEKRVTIICEYFSKRLFATICFTLSFPVRVFITVLQNILIFDSYVWYIQINELLLYIAIIVYKCITLQQDTLSPEDFTGFNLTQSNDLMGCLITVTPCWHLWSIFLIGPLFPQYHCRTPGEFVAGAARDPVLAGGAKWGGGGLNAFCSTAPWLKPGKQPMQQRKPDKTIVPWQMCQQMSWLKAGKVILLHTKAFSSGWSQGPVFTELWERKSWPQTCCTSDITIPPVLFLCQRCVVKCISLAFNVFLHLCHLQHVLPYSGACPTGQKPNNAYDEAFASLLRQTVCWSCYFIAQVFCKSLFLLMSHSLVKRIKYLPSASVLCGWCLMHS